MARVRKGQLTAPREWAKHLRFWKRFYWRAERREARRQAREEARARPPRRAFDFQGRNRPHGEEPREAGLLGLVDAARDLFLRRFPGHNRLTRFDLGHAQYVDERFKPDVGGHVGQLGAGVGDLIDGVMVLIDTHANPLTVEQKLEIEIKPNTVEA